MNDEKMKGFTLIELLVVVAVLGIVSSLAVTVMRLQIEKAQIAALVSDFRTFEAGFVTYSSDTGNFPPDHHLDGVYNLPAGVEDYIPVNRWAIETPLGGNYNWEGPDFYPYAAVSVFKPTAPASMFARVDATIDDGDLGSGKFRLGENGRYTFIVDE
jgi:prepilin-type N-terminal cleavage/methylation domain-containing protein